MTLCLMSREWHALHRARYNTGLHVVPHYCRDVAVASCVSAHIVTMWSAIDKLFAAGVAKSSLNRTAFLCCRLVVAFCMAAFVVCVSMAALTVAAVMRIKATQHENLAYFQSVEARREGRQDVTMVPETQAIVVTQPDG